MATLAFAHAWGGGRWIYETFAHGTTRARIPSYDPNFQGFFSPTSEEVRSAGLLQTDKVLTLNGVPYTGQHVLFEQIEHAHPGDPMVVTFRRGADPALRTTTIQLRPERDQPPAVWKIVFELVITVLPFLCLCIGLWAVLARPRNPFAWLVLGVLSYFDPRFYPTALTNDWTLPLGIVWATLATDLMPACLMLFGIYFPTRSQLDRRFPWVKWLLIAPILAFLPIDLFYHYGHEWNFTAIQWLAPWLDPLDTAQNLVGLVGVLWFFANLVSKLRTATGDAARRLKLLFYGTLAGLAPLGIDIVVSLSRRNDLSENVPQWLNLAIFTDLLLFPLTLAYVVVVQRALDVRLLVRQGTKYFFAKQSIVVIGFLLGTWMCFCITQFIYAHGHQRNVDIVQIIGLVGLFAAYGIVGAKRLRLSIDRRFFRDAYSSELILAELSDQARTFTETGPLLETVTARIGEALHISRIAVFLRSGDDFQLQYATGTPPTSASSPAPSHRLSLPAASTTIATLTHTRGPANVYRDDPTSWLVDATDAERSALADLSTELLVALPGRNRLIGVMALGSKRSEEPYTSSDRHLLQTVAAQTGLALENAELLQHLTAETAQRERISREIEIAREVQERLFPQTYPAIPGIDLAGFCRPAHAVGGDYYDFFHLPNGNLGIAVGDISGKGISAALLMASLRASLRSAALLRSPGLDAPLAALMEHVNQVVYEGSTSNRYATFFYAELDPRTRELTYVNAGHNPPCILRHGESPLPLEATGMVVGLLPGIAYEQKSVHLQPGDVLLAFTDGISEAMTVSDEEWGEDRMLAAATDLLAEPGCRDTAQDLLTCILAAADRFTAGAPQHDDMTLLLCLLHA